MKACAFAYQGLHDGILVPSSLDAVLGAARTTRRQCAQGAHGFGTWHSAHGACSCSLPARDMVDDFVAPLHSRVGLRSL